MRTDEELKQIALDLVQGKIFTDLHLDEYSRDSLLTTVFMPLGFMLDPGKVDTVNKFMKSCDLPQVAKYANEEIAAFARSEPVLIFQYIDKAGPRSINGYPMFSSFSWLNREEYDKVREYARKYEAAIKAVE
jgi:uncharacterized ParB-like nuclease family protein